MKEKVRVPDSRMINLLCDVGQGYNGPKTGDQGQGIKPWTNKKIGLQGQGFEPWIHKKDCAYDRAHDRQYNCAYDHKNQRAHGMHERVPHGTCLVDDR